MLVAYTDAGKARNSSTNVKGQAFHAYAIFEINSKGEKKLIEGEIFKSEIPAIDTNRLELYSIEKLISKLYKMKLTGVHIYSDSKHVVEAINGVNSLYNKDMYTKARNELNDLKSKIEWTSRENNGLCDAAVSSGDLSFFYYIGKNKISLKTKLQMKFGKNDFEEIIPTYTPKPITVEVVSKTKNKSRKAKRNKTDKEKQEIALNSIRRWIKNGNQYSGVKVNSVTSESCKKISSLYGCLVLKDKRKDIKEITEWLVNNNMPVINHEDTKSSVAQFVKSVHTRSDLGTP